MLPALQRIIENSLAQAHVITFFKKKSALLIERLTVAIIVKFETKFGCRIFAKLLSPGLGCPRNKQK
jgi:hypothetical protein